MRSCQKAFEILSCHSSLSLRVYGDGDVANVWLYLYIP